RAREGPDHRGRRLPRVAPLRGVARARRRGDRARPGARPEGPSSPPAPEVPGHPRVGAQARHPRRARRVGGSRVPPGGRGRRRALRRRPVPGPHGEHQRDRGGSERGVQPSEEGRLQLDLGDLRPEHRRALSRGLGPRARGANDQALRILLTADLRGERSGLRPGLRGHPAARALRAAHARPPWRARRGGARRGPRADDRVVQATVALRVDVDTRRGLAEGIPRLLELFRRAGVRASFFVTLGPDRSGLAIRRAVQPSFLYKMWRTNPLKPYGLRTLLSGTLLPALPVGAGAPALLR